MLAFDAFFFELKAIMSVLLSNKLAVCDLPMRRRFAPVFQIGCPYRAVRRRTSHASLLIVMSGLGRRTVDLPAFSLLE